MVFLNMCTDIQVMKTAILSFVITVFAASSAFAMGCSHDGLDPASACPVGTIYNAETGACDITTA
ncbi:MAG: hypothetical protein AAF826_05155 [Pseudomonadota bacterium]